MLSVACRCPDKRREAAGSPCARLLEKRTSWAVPRFCGITQRVPIAIVAGLTGEYLCAALGSIQNASMEGSARRIRMMQSLPPFDWRGGGRGRCPRTSPGFRARPLFLGSTSRAMRMLERNVGTVVSWHPAKGYGFLRACGGVFFIGRRDLLRYGIKNLEVGQRLSFDPARDGLGRAPRAVNVRVISEAPA